MTAYCDIIGARAPRPAAAASAISAQNLSALSMFTNVPQPVLSRVERVSVAEWRHQR
jgi:hypothetical protein